MSGATGRSTPSGVARALALAVGALGLMYVAGPAAAGEVKLTIPRATERAGVFAESTCKQDASCVRSGVLNCDRKGDLVVHCRIFDERQTDAQGKYRCNREIRMVMDPETRRAPVNGLGRWHCGGGKAAPG
jgi:hypothetical protein